MSDITTVWSNDTGRGDYVLKGADLLSGYELMTAVLISLFSDRLARADDELPDNTGDRRGWWGDAGEAVPIGSRLWLLDRAKMAFTGPRASEVPLKAQNYAAEALQWMIDDGVVGSFDISASARPPDQLWLVVTAYKTGAGKVASNYAWTWEGPLLYPAAA